MKAQHLWRSRPGKHSYCEDDLIASHRLYHLDSKCDAARGCVAAHLGGEVGAVRGPAVRPVVRVAAHVPELEAVGHLHMYSTEQYSTVQYSTVQYSTVRYSTVQYSTVQYSTVQYSTVQYLLAVTQVCPELRYLAAISPDTAASRSAL